MAAIWVLAVAGSVIWAIGGIWIIVAAFKESSTQGWLSLFVPFYILYYGISRWRKIKIPFVIGSTGLLILLGGLLSYVVDFNSEVTPVISQFMEAGERNDINQAYACCSAQGATQEEIANFINSNRQVFSGFERVASTRWEVTQGTDGAVGYTSGNIIYADGSRVPFESYLIQEEGAWKLAGIWFGGR